MGFRHFILATAGHVDHGKSALVTALTGTDPDRLPEEKARGITIDLGFASLDLPGPEDSLFRLGLIDVPGHEDFVKNMVAGVGAVDLALFVVAADDGWMPQTEEHLQILTYLRVSQAVVALTKIDLAPGSGEEAARLIRNQLAETPYAQSMIVPTSVITGQGLTELKSALVKALASARAHADIGKPRLPVDRVFSLHGIGTVATGTLMGGTLCAGQNIVVHPGARPAKIRGVQNYNREVEFSPPGTRTAVNLPELNLPGKGREGRHSDGLQRGDVITAPALGESAFLMDVLLERSRRALNEKKPQKKIKNRLRARLHHGTGNVPARLVLLGGGEVNPGDTALVRMVCEKPVYAFSGDRVIVRDWAEQKTLAGGIVLDPDPPASKSRAQAHLLFLQERAQAPQDLQVNILSQLKRDRAVLSSALLLKSHFSAVEVKGALAALSSKAKVAMAGEWAVDEDWWRRWLDTMAGTIDDDHRTHSERIGMPLTDLRSRFEKELPSPELFDPLIQQLRPRGFILHGRFIRNGKHRPTLPPHLEKAGQKLLSALSAKPLEPPSRKELAAEASSQQVIRFLIETGQVIELGPDLLLLSEHFERATALIKQFLASHGTGTVSELRQMIGTSRRVVLPLLEHLDRSGVTKRDGDQRRLSTPPGTS